MNLSLNGGWKVTHIPYNEPVLNILDDAFVPEGWLDANIPEEIHGTLRKAGIIRGHVYDKDTDEETWIEQKDWVYYKEFFAQKSLKAKKVTIEFEGLDTFCDIYLNGVKIGSSKNMHVAFKADITDELKYGARNVLVVRFYSAVKYVESMDKNGIFSTTTADRILARKAQMSYAWDFCGRCVTAGIWKDVSIASRDDAQIDSYYLYTKSIANDFAVLGLEAALDVVEGDTEDYSFAVTLEKDSVEVLSREGSLKDFQSLELTVKEPALWWPRPYGKPELYDFCLTLKKGETIVQEKRQKFGIRTVEIIQENQADGRSFIFAVNGRRLFIRGANWVPINVVFTDITDAEYEDLIDYAAGGNISMLRIWGGGIYESPRMFELCDEKGILLWNDFMFACGIYPQNVEFLDNVAQEAEFNIKKYRNYTSLVIWSGDNEDGEAYTWAGRPYEFLGDKVSKVLNAACRRFDPHRLFMPTSPCSPDEFFKGGDNPKSPHQGDMHLYITSADPGINDNRDFGKDYYKRIKTYRPRFISEFGFVSLPEKDTFYKFNFLREPLHGGDWRRKTLPFWGPLAEKNDHDAEIYFSQLYNSMALKYWIEYLRSLKWICAGSLYWKFNDAIADCKKGSLFTSLMATVDMFRMPKMTYYYTRRAYEDLVVICEETDDGYDVISCSEKLEDVKGKLVISHMDFSGNVLASKELECVAVKDSSTLLCRIAADDFKVKDAYDEYFKVEIVTDNAVIENRYFFVDICEINNLHLGNSGLKIVRAERNGSEITVSLKTDRFARSVRLNILDKRADYSDNYFEMDADSEKDITVSLHDAEGIESKVLYIEGENVDRITLSLAEI